MAGIEKSYDGRDLVETSTHRVTHVTNEQDSVTGYHYYVMQQPGAAISGRPVSFVVTVIKGGQPVVNHEFTGGLAHTSGIFINSRTEDTVESTYISDTQGRFTMKHRPEFWSLRPDNGFGVNIRPVLTDSERADMIELQKAGEIPPNPNIGISFDISIYPRWLGWITGTRSN